MPAAQRPLPLEHWIEGEVGFVKTPKGIVFQVDRADLELVLTRRWNAVPNQVGSYYIYTHRRLDDPSAMPKVLAIHRWLTDAPKGKVVDHDNHDTLDNRRQNLIVCSNRDNNANRKGPYPSNKTGFRGVSVHTTKEGYKMYVARITVAKYFPFTDAGLERAAKESERLQWILSRIDEA